MYQLFLSKLTCIECVNWKYQANRWQAFYVVQLNRCLAKFKEASLVKLNWMDVWKRLILSSVEINWRWIPCWRIFRLLCLPFPPRPLHTGCCGIRPKLVRPGQALTSTQPSWSPWRCSQLGWGRWEWNLRRLKSCFEGLALPASLI